GLGRLGGRSGLSWSGELVPGGAQAVELSRIESSARLGPVLGGQREHLRRRPVRSQAQDFFEVRLRVDAVQMAGGDEGAERRVPVQAGAVDEVAPVVAALREISELSFGAIVVDAQAAIVEEAPEAIALVEIVADRFQKRLPHVLPVFVPSNPGIE